MTPTVPVLATHPAATLRSIRVWLRRLGAELDRVKAPDEVVSSIREADSILRVAQHVLDQERGDDV